MKDAPPRNFARLHSHWLLMADTIYGANLNSMYSYVEANNQRNFSLQERSRSKVGRMARLKGSVEKIEALADERVAAAHSGVAEMLATMRQPEKEAGRLALQVCTPA